MKVVPKRVTPALVAVWGEALTGLAGQEFLKILPSTHPHPIFLRVIMTTSLRGSYEKQQCVSQTRYYGKSYGMSTVSTKG